MDNVLSAAKIGMKEPNGQRPMLDGRAFEDDLARLDPRHWPEAKRRADVLREYLAIETPTRADAARAAEGVGVTTVRLYQIVRRWRDTGSLSALVPHADRPRTSRLDPAVARILDEAIDAVLARNPNARPDHALDEVRSRSTVAGLQTPSRPTIRLRFERRLRQGRGGAGTVRDLSASAGMRLLIDRAALGVPVVSPMGVALPLVSLTADAGDGRILALRAVEDGTPFWSVVAESLADAIEGGLNGRAGTAVTLQVDDDGSSQWRELANILDRHGLALETTRVARAGYGRQIRRLIGSRLSGLSLVTHGVLPTGEERYVRWRSHLKPVGEPLDRSEALRMAQAAMRHHNEALPMAPWMRNADLPDAAALAAELREFSRRRG